MPSSSRIGRRVVVMIRRPVPRQIDRMLVDEQGVRLSSACLSRVGDHRGRGLGENIHHLLADHPFARDTVELLGGAVDQRIGERARVLHRDRRRHVLDHRVEEVARVLELAFRGPALGDVPVRHHPAAAGHRLVDHVDHAPVGELERRVGRLAICDRAHEPVGVSLRVDLEEGAGRHPQLDQLAHRHPGLHRAARQPVHLAVALVRQHQPAGSVEHVEALHHVAERRVQQDVLVAQQLARSVRAQRCDQADDEHRRHHPERKRPQEEVVHGSGPVVDRH